MIILVKNETKEIEEKRDNMSKNFKKQQGITLIALVITIIVLLILASIGIGTMSGIDQDIQNSNSSISKSDLAKVQQIAPMQREKECAILCSKMLKDITFCDPRISRKRQFMVSRGAGIEPFPPPHCLTALGQRASCPLKSTTTNPLTT